MIQIQKLDELIKTLPVDQVKTLNPVCRLEDALADSSERYANLPDELKTVALLLYQRYKDSIINNLWKTHYRFKIPSIEEFLTPAYMGEDTSMMFPYWRKLLYQFFNPASSYYEFIPSGAIGTGKTYVASFGHVYNLYRLCALKSPHHVLNVPSHTLLVLSLFTITREKAELAVLAPFVALLNNSNIFEEVKKSADFADYQNSHIIPFVNKGNRLILPNNIMVYSGSRVTHALSFSLFGAMLDEAEFARGGAEEAFAVYANLKERVRSRFLGSRFTLLTLISSAKYTEGVIAEYTRNLRPNDPYVLYVAPAIWEVKQFEAYKRGYFYVLRGTQTHPSHILDELDYAAYESGSYIIPSGCEVIQVPLAYRTDFEMNVSQALMNTAGVQLFGDETLFDELKALECDKLLPEFNLIAPVGDPIRLIDKLPQALWKTLPGYRSLTRYPNAPRYVHIDLAETSEAALCMLHKEQRNDGATLYIIDFICSITSPTRIDVHAVEQLFQDLSATGNISFASITTDQYQSTFMRQTFEASNVAKHVAIQSVDRTPTPYIQLSNLIAAQLIKTGPCPKLKSQLKAIRRNKDKIVTHRRKDMADALAGACFGAIKNATDMPVYPFEPKPVVNAQLTEQEIDDGTAWGAL